MSRYTVGDVFTETGDCPAVLPRRLTRPGWEGWPVGCTLEEGHDGEHVAGDGWQVVAVWFEDDLCFVPGRHG